MERRLPRFRLEEPQQYGLKRMLKELGIRQQRLAGAIGVSQTWVSNFVSGTANMRDRSAVEGLVGEVHRTVEERNLRGRLTDEETYEKYGFLDGILQQCGIDFRKPIVQPMGNIPVYAANYVPRPDEERKLRYALERDGQNYQFRFLVSGPPDSGKSTSIGYLLNMARYDKVQVAEVDTKLLETEDITDPETEERQLLNLIVTTIAEAWDLPQPSTGGISDFPSLMLYLRKSMANVDPRTRRLLVVDNLESLRSVALQQRLLVAPEWIHQELLAYPTRFAIVLGITLDSQKVQNTLREGYVRGASRIEVGWFDENQVLDLTCKVGGERLVKHGAQLYEQYGGQPFLTHLAVTRLADDEGLRPEQVYQQALEFPRPFNWHIRSIRKLLATEPEVQALFQLTCEAGSLDLTGLGVSPDSVDCLAGFHLVTRRRDGGTEIILPRSRFYRDLGQRL